MPCNNVLLTAEFVDGWLGFSAVIFVGADIELVMGLL